MLTNDTTLAHLRLSVLNAVGARRNSRVACLPHTILLAHSHGAVEHLWIEKSMQSMTAHLRMLRAVVYRYGVVLESESSFVQHRNEVGGDSKQNKSSKAWTRKDGEKSKDSEQTSVIRFCQGLA